MFDGICHSLYIVGDLQYMQQQCYQTKKTGKVTHRADHLKKKVRVDVLQHAPDLYVVIGNAILISYHLLHSLKVMVRSDKHK